MQTTSPGTAVAPRPPEPEQDQTQGLRSAGDIAKDALKSSPFYRGSEVLGGYYAFCLDVFRAIFRLPFQGREFAEQAWFVSSVSMVPTFLVSIPLCVNVIFSLNQLLICRV